MDAVTTTVPVGRHRIAATVFGNGLPVVVIEPSFGGWAQAWRPIAEKLAEDTTVVTYDRVPYGASSAATDARTPDHIASDLQGVLHFLGITGELVLVGHSAGGIYVRAYAALHRERVAGMVLVESSHEAQGTLLRPLLPRKVRLLDALAVPQIMAGSRRSRRGGDRRSIIREWRTFQRVIAGQPVLSAGELGDRPLVVITCAPPGAPDGDRVWRAWHDLHRDLARLSANSRHVISASRDHYLNDGDPALVVTAIAEVVASVRTGTPLGERVATSESE